MDQPASITFSTSNAELIAEACAQSGLDDFGDYSWREGYDRLLEELDRAGLSSDGALAARSFVIGNLIARLRAVAGFKANPEAMARPIVRPLIATGIVRSGTTALQKLLSMDKQFQGTEHWICSAPQVRPPRTTWEGNGDYQAARAALAAMAGISPEVIDDHGMAVDDVEESLMILAHGFHSNIYPSQFRIPAYDAWYKATDDTHSYRYLADVMRLIGTYEPDRTWLLKNPTDTFSLAEVLDVFPDAMIVQTHRDPVQAVPSIVSLIGGAHRMFRGEGQIDYPAIFARESEMWADAMDRAERVKARVPGRVLDVEFADFVPDQMTVVRAIYDHFALDLTPQTEAAMLRWLAANPRKSATMQRVTAEDFGANSAALAERFASYRSRRGYTG